MYRGSGFRAAPRPTSQGRPEPRFFGSIRASEKPTQRPSLRVEPFRSVPEAEEDLLGDLFGEGTIANQAAGQGEHGAGVAFVELGERILIEARKRHDEGCVACLRSRRGPVASRRWHVGGGYPDSSGSSQREHGDSLSVWFRPVMISTVQLADWMNLGERIRRVATSHSSHMADRRRRPTPRDGDRRG